VVGKERIGFHARIDRVRQSTHGPQSRYMLRQHRSTTTARI